jgi:hypothetical protein
VFLNSFLKKENSHEYHLLGGVASTDEGKHFDFWRRSGCGNSFEGDVEEENTYHPYFLIYQHKQMPLDTTKLNQNIKIKCKELNEHKENVN